MLAKRMDDGVSDSGSMEMQLAGRSVGPCAIVYIFLVLTWRCLTSSTQIFET